MNVDRRPHMAHRYDDWLVAFAFVAVILLSVAAVIWWPA